MKAMRWPSVRPPGRYGGFSGSMPSVARPLRVVEAGVAGRWAVSTYESAPPLSSLKPVQKGRSSAIYAKDGTRIGFIQAENIRQPVPGRTMPQMLRDATVAIEDRNFYNHGA